MQMFAFKVSGGLVGPADTNTGLKFVTKDVVGQYLSTQTRYEGASDAAQIVPRTGPIGGGAKSGFSKDTPPSPRPPPALPVSLPFGGKRPGWGPCHAAAPPQISL